MIEGLDDLIVVIGGDAATNERVKRAIAKKMADTYTCVGCGEVEEYEKGVLVDSELICQTCAKEEAANA
jgi:hypothetical protein